MKNQYTPLRPKRVRDVTTFHIFVVFIITVVVRLSYSPIVSPQKTFQLTTYDAFGYYLYLPSKIIYNDATSLKWLPAIDSQYAVIGGWQYQTIKQPNGQFVFKYLGGVALMESPFFIMVKVFI
jgi:hypothetical protein